MKTAVGAVILGLSMLLVPGILLADEVFPVDRDLYPWYPSLVRWEKTAAEFHPPAVCADCHRQQFEEWSGSLHALAFVDPVYQGELQKGIKAVGRDIARQCEGCHSPAAMVTGELAKSKFGKLSKLALAGVSCDVCHSVSGVTHQQTPSREPENGSLVLAPGRADGSLVKRGPIAPPAACGGGFHDCAESSLHRSSDLCASCHQVLHFDKHFPLEATYQEWKGSVYAQMDIGCQDCHMVDTATFLRSSAFLKPERAEYRHFFNGANYLLYHLAQAAALKSGDAAAAQRFARQYDMAVARLQAAAQVEVLPTYVAGQLVEVRLRVMNLRAGHALPTSLTNVRQMWLELTVTDETGKVLRSSGKLDPQGQLEADTRLFNSDGMGESMHFAIDPWVVIGFSRHDTIPPHGYRDVVYGLQLPKGVETVNVKARLRYRQADQKVAEALLAAVPADINLKAIYGLERVPQLPVVDMAVTSAKLAVQR
ncbi:MAG: cytochrome C [Desulfuromonadales bacterium GWC2_61_20]|nr:MAG: cytochrome C [Desulfuromonadales bacterium GWC2_61_20]HAD05314.1 cytochrome C [Desulfuromonas sp.]